MDYINIIIIIVYAILFLVYIANKTTDPCVLTISGSEVTISNCNLESIKEILPKLKPHQHGLSEPYL
ncbi:MAG: putative triple gene block protein 3 [Xinjiang alphaflexivirus 2]|nr:MAG: putative triple gene block protein 3 [Xinjiang alphaflexivirus 2]